MQVSHEVTTRPDGPVVIAEEHVLTDVELLEFSQTLSKVRTRPSKAADRRAAKHQIQADLDELSDLY